jgi:hypothetical protein
MELYRKKQKRVRPEDDVNLAMPMLCGHRADYKLVLNIALGKRDRRTTNAFIEGLAQAAAPRWESQITTDGFRPYTGAIDATLVHRVDFAQLIKTYRFRKEGEARYSPAEVAEVEVVPISGNRIVTVSALPS